jgi:putative transposase
MGGYVNLADVMVDICLREGVKPGQVTLHSDNGGPMKGATMLATLQELGVVPSFSRPSVSNDNPYSESLFKTLKYRPDYPDKKFADLDAARQWVGEFITWYNHQHLHSGIKFVTPQQRHLGLDKEILRRRHTVYQQAKTNHPNRFSKETRNWEHQTQVYLNPEKGKSETTEKRVA